MTTMTERLEEYIVVRRSLGYDLSFTARVLRGFTAFADREGADHVTVDLFLHWKESFGKASNNTWSSRLGMVRGFASWLQGLDVRTEVPPPGLIAGKLRRCLTSTPRPKSGASSLARQSCRPTTAFGAGHAQLCSG